MPKDRDPDWWRDRYPEKGGPREAPGGIKAHSKRGSYKDDLAIDSLSILEIVVDVEYQFQIKVPEDELSAIRTISDTINTVQKYLYAEVV